MSGGSYNYAYHTIDELSASVRENASELEGGEGPAYKLRLEFADLLEKVRDAAHDIEWVDSGDYGPGGELESLKAVLRDASAFVCGVCGGAAIHVDEQ